MRKQYTRREEQEMRDIRILEKARKFGWLRVGWCSYYNDRRVHTKSCARLKRLGLLIEDGQGGVVLTTKGRAQLAAHKGDR